MSAPGTMVHRCDIQRDPNAGAQEDPWGGDSPAEWGAHLSDVHCRFWFEDAQAVYDGNKQLELTRRKLMLPLDTDVTEDDRVLQVRDRRGRELADGPMRIDSVGHRMDHLILTLVEDR